MCNCDTSSYIPGLHVSMGWENGDPATGNIVVYEATNWYSTYCQPSWGSCTITLISTGVTYTGVNQFGIWLFSGAPAGAYTVNYVDAVGCNGTINLGVSTAEFHEFITCIGSPGMTGTMFTSPAHPQDWVTTGYAYESAEDSEQVWISAGMPIAGEVVDFGGGVCWEYVGPSSTIQGTSFHQNDVGVKFSTCTACQNLNYHEWQDTCSTVRGPVINLIETGQTTNDSTNNVSFFNNAEAIIGTPIMSGDIITFEGICYEYIGTQNTSSTNGFDVELSSLALLTTCTSCNNLVWHKWNECDSPVNQGVSLYDPGLSITITNDNAVFNMYVDASIVSGQTILVDGSCFEYVGEDPLQPIPLAVSDLNGLSVTPGANCDNCPSEDSFHEWWECSTNERINLLLPVTGPPVFNLPSNNELFVAEVMNIVTLFIDGVYNIDDNCYQYKGPQTTAASQFYHVDALNTPSISYLKCDDCGLVFHWFRNCEGHDNIDINFVNIAQQNTTQNNQDFFNNLPTMSIGDVIEFKELEGCFQYMGILTTPHPVINVASSQQNIVYSGDKPCDDCSLISGCMDPYSANYNPLATYDDGSCEYDSSSFEVTDSQICRLDSECSFAEAVYNKFRSERYGIEHCCEMELEELAIDKYSKQWSSGEVISTKILNIHREDYNPLCADPDAPIPTWYDPECGIDRDSGDCEDSTECVIIQVLSDNGCPVYDFEVIIDGTVVGKTDEEGIYNHTFTNAESVHDHILQMYYCFTVEGYCKSQKITMVIEQGCLKNKVMKCCAGCMDSNASNYNPDATFSTDTCLYPGCTNPLALNYDSNAVDDDGSCIVCDLTINETHIDATDDILQDGSIDITLTGNYTPYTIVWDGPNGFTSNNEDVNNLDGGAYTVTVTDSQGCEVEQIITIDAPPTIIFGCMDPLATNYDASATTDDGSCYIEGCMDATAINYDANATVDDGSCTYCDLNAIIDSITLETTAAACDGSVNILVEDLNGNPVSGYTTVITDSSSNVVSTSGLCADSYTAVITLGTCSDTVTFVIDTCISGCTDATQFNYDANATCDDGSCQPFTYGCMDASASNYSSTVNNDDGSCIWLGCTDAAADNYDATATVDDGSCTYSVTATASQTDPDCAGSSTGTATAIAANGTSPYTYLWDDPSAQTTATATGLAAGAYNCIVTDSNSASVTLSVTLVDPTAGIISGVVTNISCNGAADGNIVVTYTGLSVTQYTITDPSGSLTTTSSSADTFSMVVTTPGIYTITFTDINSCVTSEIFTVTEPAVLAANPTIVNYGCGTNSSVQTPNAGDVTLNVTGGTTPYSYSWSDGSTLGDRSGVTVGNYNVTITDGNNCVINQTIAITQPANIQIISNHADVLCNGGSTGSAALTVLFAVVPFTITVTYQSTGTVVHTGNASITLSTLIAEDYKVVVVDANGCDAEYLFTIGEPDYPILGSNLLSIPTCPLGLGSAQAVVISGGSPPYTYLWSNGQTTETANHLPQGANTYVATDANGCSYTSNIINIPVVPAIIVTELIECDCNPWIAQPPVGCPSGSIRVAVQNAVGTVTYSLAYYSSGLPVNATWIYYTGGAEAVGLAADYYVMTITDDCDTYTFNYRVGVYGCTQSIASNYDPNAVCDDGTCILP